MKTNLQSSRFLFPSCQSSSVRHGNLIAIFWPIYLFLISFSKGKKEGGCYLVLLKHVHMQKSYLPKPSLFFFTKRTTVVIKKIQKDGLQFIYPNSMPCYNVTLCISHLIHVLGSDASEFGPKMGPFGCKRTAILVARYSSFFSG